VEDLQDLHNTRRAAGREVGEIHNPDFHPGCSLEVQAEDLGVRGIEDLVGPFHRPAAVAFRLEAMNRGAVVGDHKVVAARMEEGHKRLDCMAVVGKGCTIVVGKDCTIVVGRSSEDMRAVVDSEDRVVVAVGSGDRRREVVG
jgi:hypothetical protein